MEENNYIIMCYKRGDGSFLGFLAIDGKIVPNVYNSTFYTEEMADKAISNANIKYKHLMYQCIKYEKFNNQTEKDISKNEFAAFIRCCNGENVESEFSLSSFDEAYNIILKWLENEEYTDSWYDAQYPMYSAYILEYTVDSEGYLNESVKETEISLNGEIYNN